MNQKQVLSSLDDRIEVELARRSLVDFGAYVLRTKSGEKIKVADHQGAFNTHLEYCWKIGKHAAILSPMSFAKSVWMANGAPTYFLGRNPDLRVVMISAAEDQAAKRIQECGRIIEHSDAYHKVFPHVRRDLSRPWTGQVCNVVRTSKDVSSNDHSLSAFGYKAVAGNGVGGDVLIFDDVVAANNANSEAKRAELYELLTQQWLTRTRGEPVVDRFGNIIAKRPIVIFIGTRYHAEDAYQTLILSSPEAYCTMIQRVSADFRYLECEIIGSLKNDPHPLIAQYGNWEPSSVSIPLI